MARKNILGDRRMTCLYDCDRVFASCQARYQHMQRAHGRQRNGKARCPICGSLDRNQHVERHHRDSEWFFAALAIIELRRKPNRD